jgi:hypothetical protein
VWRSRNGRVSDLPPEIPNVTIRNFDLAFVRRAGGGGGVAAPGGVQIAHPRAAGARAGNHQSWALRVVRGLGGHGAGGDDRRLGAGVGPIYPTRTP